jgi:hypothetical protein
MEKKVFPNTMTAVDGNALRSCASASRSSEANIKMISQLVFKSY